MVRLLLPLSVVAFVLAVTPAGANRSGSRHSSARLPACDQEEHTATFRGGSRAFGRARTLQMRFTLQSRSPSAPQWADSGPPEGFDEWATANAGVTHYIVDKTVTELVDGASYRAVVRFRWRNARGAVVAHAVKRTPVCRQPDARANLQVTHISVKPGTDADSRSYLVRVINGGDSEAPIFSSGLQVNGVQLGRQSTTAPLVEGDDTLLTFSGPPCETGSSLVATADTGAQVDEANEMDNALTAPCPATRRNGR
jgi:hypothetical protein